MIGHRLGERYEVTAEVGRGGMGVVYRAHDPVLGRDVAVKLIPPARLTPEAETRFQREAQIVAGMDHPAIVPIYDFGRHEGALYFVMPLVQGTDLRELLRHDPLLGDVLDVGIQVAEALEYSHARGVVHRDIKPENLMVTKDEAAGVRVRVMDFGLARAGGVSRLTRSGALVGTLSYLSPEQVVGRPVDGRTDIYALGTVLYECVASGPPFQGDPESVLYRIVHDVAQSPRELGANIDAELEGVILGCLAKDPGQRPQRAAELADTLRRYRSRLGEAERARSVAGLTRTFETVRPALAPFVGRAKEFGELQQRLNAALAGECQLALVAGEAGVGKTRLLDELATLARARRIRVLRGRSVERDRAFPYQGFCEIVQEYFRIKDTGSAPPPDFSDLAPDLVALFPMLNEIDPIRSSATGDVHLTRGAGTGPENRTEVFELLARTLARLAGGRPLVLMLEDLHAAEVSIEALQYVVRRLGPTPTLIVGTYRTTEVDARHPLARMIESFRGDRRFVSVTLGPLPQAEHRALVETLLGGGTVSDDLADKLFCASEGNAFFSKELVRSLVDSGGIVRDESGVSMLSAEAGLSADAMPATIQQAVENRIERLPAELREVLALASVIGRSFAARDLESLAEGRQDVDDALDRLLGEGLVEEERGTRGDVLAFSSGVVRDVLYAGISRRRRRSLHRRYAEVLEARHAGRLDRALPQLVHHFSQGDVAEKTVEYGLRLARSALETFSAEEAARAARAALEFLDEGWEGEPGAEGEARILLARAHRAAGDVDAALREAAAAARILEPIGPPPRAVAALRLCAETAWQARRSEEAARWVERGLPAARAAGEPESLAELLSLAATLASLRGEAAEANEYLAEAARLAPQAREAEAEEAVPPGGRLVVGLANPVRTTEPSALETLEEVEVAANVYETLLLTDARGSLLPHLCEQWESAEGGQAFLLHLRRDVSFSDGAPLTAEAVRASFEAAVRGGARELAPAFVAIRGSAAYRSSGSGRLEGTLVRGEHDLEIRLSEPLPIYPALLTDGRTGIVRAVPGEGGGVRLLGTGPFVLASRDAGRIVLGRSPAYWKGAAATLEAIEFRTALSATAIARGFRSGELDLARDLLPQDLEDMLRDPALRRGLVEAPRTNTYLVLFNCLGGPVAGRDALRRALAGVVRTSDLVWRTLGRFAQPAACLIPPGLLSHDPGRRGAPLGREQAVALLRAAGLEPPIRLTASVHPLVQDRYGALLASLFAAWSELGVEVAVAPADMSSFLASYERNDGIDLLIGRWNADYDDPDNFAHALFHSATGLWRRWFSSPAADRLLEEARAETRPAARETLYRRFESLLQESAALLPLFHDIDYRLAGPKVRGLKLRAAAPHVNYAQLGKVESVRPRAEARWSGGGILHVPIAGVVSTLDPAPADTVEQHEILSSVYDTLTRDVGARVVPWLAAELRAEDGGRRYRIRLREDVRFHDGRRLGARDVRYSFERLLKAKDSNSRWFFTPMRGAKAVLNGEASDLSGLRIHSASELTIELDEPVAFFPALLAHPSTSVVPEGSDPAAAGMGTGPFRVASFEPGRRLELERNRSHWRAGVPSAEGLVFTFGVPPEEMLSGFRSGRFSLASDLYPADVEALRREPGLASGYRETPRLITYFAAFNVNRPPLDDRALRRRLLSAVDVPRLVQKTLGRMAIPAHGLIPPGLLGHDPAGTARSDVAPAPQPAGSGVQLELKATVHPVYLGGYAALARQLSKAFAEKGVRIGVANRTIEEFLEATRSASADVWLGRWSADFPDADTFVHILHTQDGPLGRLCGSAELDRLIERGRTESVPSVRHGLYREIEEILAREAIVLPLFHEQAYRFARPEVEGLTVQLGTTTVAYDRLRIRG